MDYYSAIRNNEFMKFLGKWMELEKNLLSEINQSLKNTRKWTPKNQITPLKMGPRAKQRILT